ncbi:MAG TPA: recombinase family protein [Candidatus Saccharimonadales bacterium]|nr:recombinase family protein [Candidatus Saccharimonadales bacterium]
MADTPNDETLDLTTLRYILYARKSRQDEEQVRSIPDQVNDCEELAQRLGLNVVEVIREEKSAKTPRNRPKFTDMLKRIKAKEFDAILTWHPDRLARNMVEAGRLIHMLDTGQLKDIRFHSHQFSNDANGKLLLGMLFVFSKHYSDDLSTKVSRGVKGNLKDYKSGGTPKHGYIRDKEGIYRKDGDNFVVMQKAWQLRASGKSQQFVCDYINAQGYQKFIAKRGGHVTFVMTDSVLSNMFKDTFYYGELNQAGQTVDLVEAPVPFEPMIDRETYFKVQELSRGQRRTSKGRKPFLPLRYMVFCDVCKYERPMQVGRSTGRDKVARLNYRCLNPKCTRKVGEKSIRGKLVFGEINRVIEDKLAKLPPEAYDEYLKELKAYSKTAMTKLRSELSRAKTTQAGYERRIIELSPSLSILQDDRAKQTVSEQIAEASQQMQKLEPIIKQHERSIKRSSLPAIDKEQFKATIAEMAEKLKAADVFQKDIIVSNLFLKLSFDGQKMTNYSLKEPYASLVEMTSFQAGGGAWI